MSFVVLNIPHSGKIIPDEYKKDILLNNEDLQREIDFITDWDIDRMFTGFEGAYSGIICKTSRFLCDMERFVDDEDEPMAKLGMGAVYTKTPWGRQLREYNPAKRRQIIEAFYWPYHNKLTDLTGKALENYGKCLIVDCHSYYENVPFIEYADTDICIGADSFHTDKWITDRIIGIIKKEGYKVSVNTPFSGSLVPLKFYKTDGRVKTVMIEVNKRIYMQGGETDETKLLKLQGMFYKLIKDIEKMMQGEWF